MTTDHDKTAAIMAKLLDQSARLDGRRAAVRREQDRLDQLVAEAVSANPLSTVWYQIPGPLTIGQAQSAANLTALALHQSVARYQARHRAAKKKGRRTLPPAGR